MGQSFHDDDIGVRSGLMKVAHDALHQLVRPVGRNQTLGFIQRNGEGRTQARGRPDEMGGTLGPGGMSRRLTDGFTKGNTNATIIKGADETESYRSEPDFGSAGSKVKRMRHGTRGLI
jgi:hypothetical protein